MKKAKLKKDIAASINARLLNISKVLTFKRRNTSIVNHKGIFNAQFKQDTIKQRQWQSFLKRHHLMSYDQFSEVVTKLENFIVPVCETNRDNIVNIKWNPEKWEWKFKSDA